MYSFNKESIIFTKKIGEDHQDIDSSRVTIKISYF